MFDGFVLMFSTQYLVRVGLVATEGGVLEATEAREREKEQRCGPLVLSLSHWLSSSLSFSLSGCPLVGRNQRVEGAVKRHVRRKSEEKEEE